VTQTRGIDFRKLTLLDALDLAVLIEEEARDRYEEFADQMDVHHTPEAAHFFRMMTANEEKHRAELARRRAALFGDARGAVTRNMIFDIEAPDYDEARAFMTARRALTAALRSEEKAHAFFTAAIPRLEDPEVRKLFEELREEEVEHQRLVREQIARQPPDPDLQADDFADEPVAQ
jgi:erythrin-vacuolar iron transport family protein